MIKILIDNVNNNNFHSNPTYLKENNFQEDLPKEIQIITSDALKIEPTTVVKHY